MTIVLGETIKKMSTEEGGLLTAAELGSIQSTWSLVAKDLKGNGVQFFIQ